MTKTWDTASVRIAQLLWTCPFLLLAFTRIHESWIKRQLSLEKSQSHLVWESLLKAWGAYQKQCQTDNVNGNTPAPPKKNVYSCFANMLGKKNNLKFEEECEMTWGRVKEYRQLLPFLSQILPTAALKPHKNKKKATDSMYFVIRRWWCFLAQTSLILDSQNLLKPYFTNYLDMLIIWGHGC